MLIVTKVCLKMSYKLKKKVPTGEPGEHKMISTEHWSNNGKNQGPKNPHETSGSS